MSVSLFSFFAIGMFVDLFSWYIPVFILSLCLHSLIPKKTLMLGLIRAMNWQVLFWNRHVLPSKHTRAVMSIPGNQSRIIRQHLKYEAKKCEEDVIEKNVSRKLLLFKWKCMIQNFLLRKALLMLLCMLSLSNPWTKCFCKWELKSILTKDFLRERKKC